VVLPTLTFRAKMYVSNVYTHMNLRAYKVLEYSTFFQDQITLVRQCIHWEWYRALQLYERIYNKHSDLAQTAYSEERRSMRS